MRTALVLLFLLALAAVPGSLLPQSGLNPAKVAAYRRSHPALAPILERLGFFEVFASPWFAAIYLLLFISLIGCIVPRVRLHGRALRRPPPAAPRHLDRLRHSERFHTALPAGEVVDQARAVLRGWRVAHREEASGAVTLSAERGYLRETGNIVFHVALSVLLAGVAIGKLWGYQGSVLVEEGRGFCNTVQSFDQFSAGPIIRGAGLTPFCVDLATFRATYDPDGTPSDFAATIRYTPADGTPRDDVLQVNHPLRLQGVRVYLISHGFSPRFTITTAAGQTFRGISAPFLPQDGNLTSEGAVKLPDARPDQLAIDGLFAPTAVDSGDGVISSGSPQPFNPAVAIFLYRGQLGLDTGRAQSVYSLDQGQIAAGALKKVGAKNLHPGEALVLADGTSVRFDGYLQWASMQVSRDPGQSVVLVAFGFLLVGLTLSLSIRRRRVWLRVSEAPGADGGGAGRSVVEVGGLARSEAGGFTREFGQLVERLRQSRKD
ncbi:MAG: cytochrome c biogenesis protein ResB [Actinobacteria bacterium]|nr:cytochrome c biogenesis protein ResB [Actinomycetota bacterium]MBI3685976.1 cytochrome c biogenesis protein ResB [Actinomycetota bacterium]